MRLLKSKATNQNPMTLRDLLGKLLRRRLRVLCTAVLLPTVGLGGLMGLFALDNHRDNMAELKSTLPVWPSEGKGQRVLVVSPHCDDETLGCGGLIRRLVSEGAEVRVVIATNGDGFQYALTREYRELRVPPKRYIEYGYHRQFESLSALRDAGLPKDDVIFLGYPDRGLSRLWLYNWESSDLYQSPYTKDRRSPYRNSYTRQAPYCGSSLLSDLKAIISDFQPTSVYYPHSSDQHADHWALNCFVTEALYETGLQHQVRSGLYLVHRGDWPVPHGRHQDLHLSPPAHLKGVGTSWYSFDLTTAETEGKAASTSVYYSQMDMMRKFLTSFTRTNELFGTYPAGSLIRAEGIDRVDDRQWKTISPSIRDPIGDGLSVDIARGGDLRDIRCCYDDEYLHIRLGLAHRHSNRSTYCIRLRTFPGDEGKSMTIRMKVKGCDTEGVRWSRARDAIQVSIPLSDLGDWTALMLSADSSVKTYGVDRTAWRLLER